MNDYTKRTLKLLYEENWYESRSIDISESIEMLKDREYKITESFIDFYKKFGNLCFYFAVNERNRKIEFNVSKSFGIDYDEVIIHIYPQMIGCEVLTLIGNIDGASILTIDENNVIYCIYDGEITCYGSENKAIENLFNKGWREMDNCILQPKVDLENLKTDWKYVRQKEIENHQLFVVKYRKTV